MVADGRCPWPRTPLDSAYHDTEWGMPQHDDRALFELLILEGAQAGLSWSTILNKRMAYRRAYADFDIARVAAFDDADQARLLADAGIVRNRLKIAASVKNARAVVNIQRTHGSLDAYLWAFVGGSPVQNHWRMLTEVPARSPISDALSRDLRARGCNFVGSTICYALMQAAGLVNDHLVSCYRHAPLADGPA